MTASTKDKEKVYLTRDEDDNVIWVWRKPNSGLWSPKKLKNCEVVMYQREDRSLSNATYYLVADFKNKFGITLSPKMKKCCHLSKKLLDNEDYKLISNDPDRKQ